MRFSTIVAFILPVVALVAPVFRNTDELEGRDDVQNGFNEANRALNSALRRANQLNLQDVVGIIQEVQGNPILGELKNQVDTIVRAFAENEDVFFNV